MATIWGPNIVTDGLVMALDVANVESYAPAGTIPQRSESPFTAWVDYYSNQANYTVVGDDGIILLNTSENAWIGYFPATSVATGYWTMVFEYQHDGGSTANTQVEVNDDGVGTNNIFYDHVYATTEKQIFRKTANLGLISIWCLFP